MRARLLVGLLAVSLGSSGCAFVGTTAAGPPRPGTHITAAMERSPYIGETVMQNGQPVKLTLADLSGYHGNTGMESESVAQALHQGKPVVLLFNAVADGTQGGREVIYGHELQTQYGKKVAFIMVDPWMQPAFANRWNLGGFDHSAFFINTRGKIIGEFLVEWGRGNLIPVIKELIRHP